MSELLIQAFLRRSPSTEAAVAELLTKYSIVARRHGKYPHLVLFKYDQQASPFEEPLVRECRGIILDESKNWDVVSRAFDKFFNHGEPHAAPVDWATAAVQEKVDGSLCVVYAYDGLWHVATTGSPDASGNVHESAVLFSELFWETFSAYGSPLPPLRSQRLCFFFELTSPHNRVVVQHQQAALTLLGARDLDAGELTVEQAGAALGGPPLPAALVVSPLPRVRVFGLGSFEEIVDTFGSMSPLAQEGYVVVDAAFRRVKVKHPGYVALHHAKDGMTTKAFVHIARTGETSEVIAAFPEFKPRLDEAKSRVDAFVQLIETEYARLADIPEQKAFALEAVKTSCPAALFAIRKKKASSAREFVVSMRVENLVDQLGYRSTGEKEPVTEGVDA
jgi:hypothetical protein